VVLDVHSFEILAMASAPGYSPGDRRKLDPETVRNRSIIDEFEPGSIFKAIAVAAALEDGVVDLETPIDCLNGVMPVPGSKPLRDVHAYDVLPVKGVITKSSNIGTARIVAQHGHDEFYRWMQRFGVGVRTGVGLAEGAGTLHPRARYRAVDFTRLPIGYGVGVTQLQLACAYAAIANGGTLKQPRLVLRLEDRDGGLVAAYPTETVRRVISEATSRKMIEALETVTAPGGTATEAGLEHYTSAGKTGTAHKWNPKLNPPGYDEHRYYSSFVGFFPANDPRLCIAITVDEPEKKSVGAHYGGRAAGPVFRRIAEQAAFQLNIQPDKPVDVAAGTGGHAGSQVPPFQTSNAVSATEPAAVTAVTAVTAASALRRPSAPGGFRLEPVLNPTPR
jgi:cell division protein FtsI (penicillin-binding protein 3)